MANNFNDAQVSLTDATLTDVYTASNKSLVIAGTISNTTTTSMNVSIKKYDNSSLELPKIVLASSDKVQAQTDDASGNCDVHLQLLTDVS
jgi:hypothetical protein